MGQSETHFVTLIDENFLPQALALRGSLLKHCTNAHLWILCVTTEAFDVLKSLDLSRTELIHPSFYDDSEIMLLRHQRSRKEICWTLTPTSIKAVFKKRPDIETVTYVDADLFFLKSPEEILEEFQQSGKHVLITRHDYHPIWDKTASSGEFNVQFITVNRSRGLEVIEAWDRDCRDWCFDYHWEGLIGDQGYLSQWPDEFPDLVHIAKDTAKFQGPWNAQRFRSSLAVTFHFHGAKITPRGIALKGPYPISPCRHEYFYRPYNRAIKELFSRYPLLKEFGTSRISQLTFLQIGERFTRWKYWIGIFAYTFFRVRLASK